MLDCLFKLFRRQEPATPEPEQQEQKKYSYVSVEDMDITYETVVTLLQERMDNGEFYIVRVVRTKGIFYIHTVYYARDTTYVRVRQNFNNPKVVTVLFVLHPTRAGLCFSAIYFDTNNNKIEEHFFSTINQFLRHLDNKNSMLIESSQFSYRDFIAYPAGTISQQRCMLSALFLREDFKMELVQEKSYSGASSTNYRIVSSVKQMA